MNRAELVPACVLAERTNGDIALHSDSKYVVQGYEKGRHLHPAGSNADLWARLGAAVASRAGSIRLVKVPAHVSREQATTSEQALQDFIGNGYADAWAGVAAETAQLDIGAIALHAHSMHMLACIHNRSISAHMDSFYNGAP